jgi:6-phosphogluconate dehydrogenase (decarboxylating)
MSRFKAKLENWKVELDNMYMYYFKKAREYYDSHSEDEEELTEKEREIYELGKSNGAVEVIETINFMMFGGRNAFDTWMSTLAELAEEEGKDPSSYLDMMTGGKNAPRFTGDDEEEDDDDV